MTEPKRMKSFDEIYARAVELGPKKIAFAGKTEDKIEEAIRLADKQGIATCTIHPDAKEAVAEVREGRADILLKGGIDTKSFMKAILDEEKGLRTGRLLSHVAVIEVGERLLLVTDGGIVIHPTLEEKVGILKNVVPVAQRLGMTPARTAILAAIEKVNPKMPETVDAEKLSRMDIPGLIIQGPLAVDNAVSPEAAATKGLSGPVVGRADVLLVPSILVGNAFCKAIMYFAKCRFGGFVSGTSRPVCFLSRADTAVTKLNTMALGVLLSEEK